MAVFFVTCSLFAQGITTASAYFKTISEFYGSIKDFEVDFDLTVQKKESSGVLSYKSPDLIRMDYTNPQEQVICFNGDTLTVYLPGSAVLQQQVNSSSTSTASLVSGQGLSLMSRYYTVAYEIGQNPVPLEDGSDEMVVKFILTKKNASEAFNYINIAVNPETKLIRRMVAVTPKNEEFIFNFYEYSLNQNISEQRFIYNPPTDANNLNNFLFSE